LDSKNDKEDSDDDEQDEKENERVQEDGERGKKYGNIFSKIWKYLFKNMMSSFLLAEITDRNDYPWIFLRYSVQNKELLLIIEWSACGYTDKIGILNMHLHPNATHVRWELQHDNIETFKRICQHDQALLDRFEESIDLIPKDNLAS
jgi:hypothetical protein